MLRSVYLKSLRDMRRAIAWWSLGLIAMTGLMIAVYPTIRDNHELDDLVQNYPEALKAFIAFGGNVDYTSGAGYLGSELFSFMVPLLLSVAAIGAGARATAGEEEAGTIELLLSNPVSRQRIVLEKTAALITEIMLLALVLWVSLLVGVEIVDMKLSAANLAAATAAASLFAFSLGAIAVLSGAATGRRSLAIGVPAALGVAAYLVSSLGSLVDSIEVASKASPYYHYVASDPLRHGLELVHVGFLLGLGFLAAGLAVLAFERRDLAA